MLTTSGGCGGERGGSCSSSRNDGHAGEAPSRENLLSRVQELERELRLADVRDARSMGAAVGAEHIRARKNVMDDEVSEKYLYRGTVRRLEPYSKQLFT